MFKMKSFSSPLEAEFTTWLQSIKLACQHKIYKQVNAPSLCRKSASWKRTVRITFICSLPTWKLAQSGCFSPQLSHVRLTAGLLTCSIAFQIAPDSGANLTRHAGTQVKNDLLAVGIPWLFYSGPFSIE